jgi:hypothetical protein
MNPGYAGIRMVMVSNAGQMMVGEDAYEFKGEDRSQNLSVRFRLDGVAGRFANDLLTTGGPTLMVVRPHQVIDTKSLTPHHD